MVIGEMGENLMLYVKSIEKLLESLAQSSNFRGHPQTPFEIAMKSGVSY